MAMALENLKEILKLTLRNAKLSLSLGLLLLLLIPTSLLFLGDNLAIQPFIKGLFQRAPKFFQSESSSATFPNESIQSPNIDEEAVFTTVSFCLSLLSIAATIFTSAMTYYDHVHEHFSTTDLFWAIVRIRWLFMTISALVLGFLISIAVAVSAGLISWANLGLSTALLLVSSSIYLGVVWIVGHVVMVLIRACDEVGALGRAGELLKGKISRRLTHNLLLTVVATAIPGILAIESDPTSDILFLIIANVVCLVILFLCVVYTLLSHECKKKQEGNVGVEGGNGHSLDPTTTLLIGSDSLP